MRPRQDAGFARFMKCCRCGLRIRVPEDPPPAPRCGNKVACERRRQERLRFPGRGW